MFVGVGGMDSNCAGTGGIGTEMLSPCRALDDRLSTSADVCLLYCVLGSAADD